MFIKKGVLALVLSACVFSLHAQSKAPENWFNKDKSKDGVQGVSTDEAYTLLKAKGKKAKTIVVAVLDSGVDYLHEDLKDVMWTNPGEIAGNGKDDDKNGYVDDIHGWNFIGGANGQNIHHETYELTREYVRLSKKYDRAEPSKLSGADKKEYAYFLEVKAAFEEERGSKLQEQSFVTSFFEKVGTAFAAASQALGKSKITADDMPALRDKKNMRDHLGVLETAFAQGIDSDNMAEKKDTYLDQYGGALKYGLNPDYDPRTTIVGDNPDDCRLETRFYGNNDVKGPDASHGTHVAGIIAAKRGNKVGMDGVADNVRIMSVRCVPDGDERDKDVANAIRYAVDNGASIINMSFGKGYSSNKQYVDDAIRYAREHDVLLVHAAGNDSENNDASPNFPNDNFAKRGGMFKPKKAANWMEIGALHWKSGEKRPASFSNYGKKNVDLFAPGVAIYSTVPENKYDSFQGTSMASPAAAGVAAILRSYFPDLSTDQIKKAMMQSVVKQSDGKVYKPGSTELVNFEELCVTGGAVSASGAVEAASKMSPSKKIKKMRWRLAGEAAEKTKVVTP